MDNNIDLGGGEKSEFAIRGKRPLTPAEERSVKMGLDLEILQKYNFAEGTSELKLAEKVVKIVNREFGHRGSELNQNKIEILFPDLHLSIRYSQDSQYYFELYISSELKKLGIEVLSCNFEITEDDRGRDRMFIKKIVVRKYVSPILLPS